MRYNEQIIKPFAAVIMSGLSGSFRFPGGISLRFVKPSDDGFVLDMFIAARPWLDWASLDADAVRALYEDQLRITRIGMGNAYPEHMDFIIEKTGQAVGHLVVDLGLGEWRISTLELHPLARRKGIGADVILGLQAAATSSLMPLTVSTPSILEAALAFYGKMGFGIAALQPPMVGLAWFPPGHPLGARLS